MNEQLTPKAFLEQDLKDYPSGTMAELEGAPIYTEKQVLWLLKEFAQREVNKYVNCECTEDQRFLDENGHVRCAVCYRISVI